MEANNVKRYLGPMIASGLIAVAASPALGFQDRSEEHTS